LEGGGVKGFLQVFQDYIINWGGGGGGFKGFLQVFQDSIINWGGGGVKGFLQVFQDSYIFFLISFSVFFFSFYVMVFLPNLKLIFTLLRYN